MRLPAKGADGIVNLQKRRAHTKQTKQFQKGKLGGKNL